MPRVVHRACPLCEATCGLRITVDGDAITDIRGDRDDPFSKGYVCPKGVALGELHADPDRLTRPLRKVGDGWEEMDWEAALDLAAEKVQAAQRDHGQDSVAIYLGNPNVHNLGALMFGPEVLRTVRTKNRYSATSADQLPHMLIAHWMFGHQLLMPVPDIDRTDFLLILGANPAASNGSIMTAPAMGTRLKAIRARGGRVVLVDPRRTETARLVDEHHFIKPGTDALLLASLLAVVFEEGLGSPGRLAAHTDGLDAVRAGVAAFPPERTAAATGLPAETVRALAREIAGAETACVYGRMGASVQKHGVTCQWLCQVLNVVTGNLDRPGGAMFSTPAVDPMGRLKLVGRGGHGRWKSRVRGLPEVGGELPCAVLAEEIDTPGEGQIKVLMTVAGNPVLSTPDGGALERALPKLDFMICIDPYLNATTRNADLILPPVSPLERDHYDVVFNALAVRNVAKWSPRVFEPGPERLDDWQILAGLHIRLSKGVRARARARARAWAGPRRLLDIALRAGPHGGGLAMWSGLTLDKLAAAEHGMDLGPLEPVLPGRLMTSDGRINAAPPAVLEDLPRLEALLEARLPEGYDLQLIGRRHLRSNNSWMHNTPRLMKGKPRCTLLVHPDDAAARGLVHGGTAEVRSRVGAVLVPVEVSDTVMRGVVSLPHGFGHGRQGVKLSVASAHAGVSINDLTDAQEVDGVGGTAVLNGTPVVVKAAG
jgi:anaerobic selenocysteine-containing dehydrogenase